MINGFTADKVYNVLPDSKRCVQRPCLYLYYLIDNHQHYFISNTKMMFSEAEHYVHANMIIQNISNFSLVATFYSEITCLPQSFIYFHNVVNITIKNIVFSECGNSLKLIMTLNNCIGLAYFLKNVLMYMFMMCIFVIQWDMV